MAMSAKREAYVKDLYAKTSYLLQISTNFKQCRIRAFLSLQFLLVMWYREITGEVSFCNVGTICRPFC